MEVSYIFIVLPIFVLGDQNCSDPLGFMHDTTTVKFSVVMTLRESVNGVTCGPILESQLQLLAAIQMTVDKLNSPAYLPSIRIGYEVYDDCGLDWFAEQAIHQEFGCDPAISSNHCISVPNQARHMGLLGLSRSLTSEEIYKSLNQLQVPVISPFSSILWQEAASNIRVTRACIEREVAFMVKILKVANWTYVTAVHTDDAYGTFGLGKLTEVAAKEGICVHTIGSLSFTEAPSSYVNGLINKLITSKLEAKISVIGVIFFGRGPSGKIFIRALKDNRDVQPIELIVAEGMEEYRNLLASENKLPNRTILVRHMSKYLPSFDKYYNDKIQYLTTTPIDPVDSMFIQFKVETTRSPAQVNNNTRNSNVFSVMDAVYTLANAYRKAYSDRCGELLGICKQLEEITWQHKADYVSSVNGQYSDINATNLPQELQQASLSVGNNTELEAFAYISTGVGMVMSDSHLSEYMSSWTPSVCKGRCSHCLTSDQYPYAYLDGDQLLLGIFSTHESSTTDSFGCGDFKHFSVQGILPEVFLYALQVARQQTGVNFGAVVFNDCESASRATLITAKFMAGEIKVRKPGTNEVINPTKVILVVGACFSGTTIPMTMFFTGLSLPVVSYTASSPDLDDRINFPYFLRTVPSDVDQAKAMVQIIKTMGWEYVSVMYVDNNYGRKGQKAFLDFAKNEGICVMEPTIPLSQTGDSKEDYNILTILRDQSPEVVILFAIEARIARLVSLLNEQRKLGIQNRFIFLASEDWGKSTYILEQGGETCLGSITMALESSKSADNGFHNYIKQRTPGTIKNPWFDLLWIEQFQCFLNNSFDNKYQTPCSMSDRIPDDKARTWVDNQRTVHLLNGVLAIAHGLKQANDKLCANKGFACPEYFKNKTEVVIYIRNTELSSGGVKFRVFDENGNGNVGFEILNIKPSGTGLPNYQPVGTFAGNSLQLKKEELQFYHGNIDAKCDTKLCAKCNQQMPGSSSTTPSICSNAEFGNRVIDFAIISILVIICILFIAKAVIDSCRIKGLSKQTSHHEGFQLPDLASTYKPDYSASSSRGNNYREESVRGDYEAPRDRYTPSRQPQDSNILRAIPQNPPNRMQHDSHIYATTKEEEFDVA